MEKFINNKLMTNCMPEAQELTTLVVENEAPILELLRRMLTRNGVTDVDAVATTQEGLDLLRERDYGLVFTDLNQKPSGIEVYRAAIAKGSDAYIMSGYAPDILEAQVIAQDHFLQKPFDIMTIDEIIKECIARKRDQS